MLDVDFLREQPGLIPQTIVYRYRSGLLRPAVMRKLRSIAALSERQFDVCSARDPNCFGGGSFSLWIAASIEHQDRQGSLLKVT